MRKMLILSVFLLGVLLSACGGRQIAFPADAERMLICSGAGGAQTVLTDAEQIAAITDGFSALRYCRRGTVDNEEWAYGEKWAYALEWQDAAGETVMRLLVAEENGHQVIYEDRLWLVADDLAVDVEALDALFCIAEQPLSVMVDGVLYQSSGEESDVTGRCGVMDGEIRSSVTRTALPTVDDQSNFGSGYAYQYGRPGSVELLIDGTWYVFRSSTVPAD